MAQLVASMSGVVLVVLSRSWVRISLESNYLQHQSAQFIHYIPQAVAPRPLEKIIAPPRIMFDPSGILEKSYSQISVNQTSIIRNYWVIRRRWTVPTFFPIIYCNKTTYYSNFDYPKKSIFRSDSSVPIKENAIKLPFKIRSPNVTHGDHDFFVWSSSMYTPE